ncbi:MAG: hypothetical protein HYW25_01265 [Candidatus Aenigmarchaeota archaeon]|nr:hypothetical protein [Candidatus Aenigmarchaeota archaeon]
MKNSIESGTVGALPQSTNVDVPANIASQMKEIRDDLHEIKKFHTKARLNFFEVEKRLVKVESGEGHTEHLKSHTPAAVERKIKSLEEKLEGRLKSLEDIIMLLEVELVKSRGTSLVEVPSRFGDSLRVLEEKMEEIENSRFKMPAESLALNPRIKNLEENLISVESRMKRQMQDVENRILSSMAGPGMTEGVANTLLAKLSDEMRDMKIEMEKAKLLKAQLENLERTTPTKNHVDKIRGDLAQQVSVLKEQVEQIIASGKTAGAISVDVESDLRKQFEDYKRFLDTHIIDMEENMQKIVADEARKIMFTDEMQKMVARMESLEKDIEQRAYAVVVREFETFAEAIDKRYPDLVTKEDLEDRMKGHKVPAAEMPSKPDIAPIMGRLSLIEDRINELGEAMQAPIGAAVVIE